LELRTLFAFEEMTDSRLELMILFLFSSKKHQNPSIISHGTRQPLRTQAKSTALRSP